MNSWISSLLKLIDISESRHNVAPQFKIRFNKFNKEIWWKNMALEASLVSNEYNQAGVAASENPKSKDENCRGLNYGFFTLY